MTAVPTFLFCLHSMKANLNRLCRLPYLRDLICGTAGDFAQLQYFGSPFPVPPHLVPGAFVIILIRVNDNKYRLLHTVDLHRMTPIPSPFNNRYIIAFFVFKLG